MIIDFFYQCYVFYVVNYAVRKALDERYFSKRERFIDFFNIEIIYNDLWLIN